MSISSVSLIDFDLQSVQGIAENQHELAELACCSYVCNRMLTSSVRVANSHSTFRDPTTLKGPAKVNQMAQCLVFWQLQDLTNPSGRMPLLAESCNQLRKKR